jgi:hypothetical protein
MPARIVPLINVNDFLGRFLKEEMLWGKGRTTAISQGASSLWATSDAL